MKPKTRKDRSSSVVQKASKTCRNERDHPLKLAFDDATTSYRSHLLSNASALLNNAHQDILNSLTTACASPDPKAEARVTTQKALLAELTSPLRGEQITVTCATPSTSSPVQAAAAGQIPRQDSQTTLGASFDEFSILSSTTHKTLIALVKEHTVLNVEINTLCQAILNRSISKQGKEENREKQKMMQEVKGMVETMEKQALAEMESMEKSAHEKQLAITNEMVANMKKMLEDDD